MSEPGGVPGACGKTQLSLVNGGNFGKYRLVRKIGSGGFGEIYLAICTSNGEKRAIKMERTDVAQPQLVIEKKLLKILAGGEGIPHFRWYGQENGFNFLVMDLLGPSLEDLFTFCSRRFNLKTVLMVANQMITRVEHIHSRGYLHRDLKPENFLMGIGPRKNQVYMIDYGLAKRFQDSQTKAHIPYREGKGLLGTARYCSINTMRGVEQSRRDDLEALGYSFVYFLRGNLPWMGIEVSNLNKKHGLICDKKRSTSLDQLCEGLPEEFAVYLNYCRGLGFEEQPDYDYLRKLLRLLAEKMNIEWDFVYDWTVPKEEEGGAIADVQKKPEA